MAADDIELAEVESRLQGEEPSSSATRLESETMEGKRTGRTLEKQVKIILEGEDAMMRSAVSMHPLLQQNQSSRSHAGDFKDADVTELYCGEALDDSPIEAKIFKEHTRFFGLLFRSCSSHASLASTWSMERTFQDGHARMHKKEVYIGYVIMIVVSLILLVRNIVQDKYTVGICPADFATYCKEGGTMYPHSTCK